MYKRDILKYKERLVALSNEAIESGEFEYNKDLEEHKELMSIYKIKSQIGKFIYEDFSDEELCNYIRKRAKELSHVPAQKEVYWIYRMYIKHRFTNWPRALRLAVLSSKAGQGGHRIEVIEERESLCEKSLMEIKSKAIELRRPPHMAEMKHCIESLKYRYTTWAQVLEAAGINSKWKNENMLFIVSKFTVEEKKLLEGLKNKAIELGRAPLRREIDEETRTLLKNKCKTWRNTLYQVGIEPIEKPKTFTTTYLDVDKNKEKLHREGLSGGLYKIVKPNNQEKAYLQELKSIIKKLGRAPIKEELPEELYKTLMNICGSYRNVLHQQNVVPLDKTMEQKVKKEIKAKK